jgi:ParB-like chromosome segregation protein Spo0J
MTGDGALDPNPAEEANLDDAEAPRRDEGGVAVTGIDGGVGGPDEDPSECGVWAGGLPAAAVGPIEWWAPTRLRPYTPRSIERPSFRSTPSWRMLRHLMKESGVREPLLILPGGQVVDGVHRLALARALGLAEVPVRVLHLPDRLSEADRLRLDTTVAVLAAGRRQLASSRVQGLLFGVSQAEFAAGVLNDREANLRRGRQPGTGPVHPTQRARAEARGVSDRTLRRLTRLAREAPEALQSALAAGALSVREAERQLAANTRARPLPNGPPAVRELSMGMAGGPDRAAGAKALEVSRKGTVGSTPEATTGTARWSHAEAPRGSSGHAPATPAGPAAPSASVAAFLAVARELEALTERFLRDTASWTGAQLEARHLTVRQTVEQLDDLLEWMQDAEGRGHAACPG